MAKRREAREQYQEMLSLLAESRIPFLVAGTFAVNAYTGINRPTKDLDIFCKGSDFPKILTYFQGKGYETAIEDERWLAKIKRAEVFMDVIFNSTIAVNPVTGAWFQHSHRAEVFGIPVQLLPPTELIWSKIFVQDRMKYEGADVAHVILTQSEKIDWQRLLNYMEQYWEVLLMQAINFRFVYPTERKKVPAWLMSELVERLKRQEELPLPETRVCRGRLFSRDDYLHDITAWKFADVVGGAGEKPYETT